MITLFDDLKEEGRQAGLQEGLEKGLREGWSDALVSLLDARGVKLSDDDRKRIATCRDTDQLREWLLRAPQIQTAAELFSPH